MIINIKKSASKQWGFLEKYKKYEYNGKGSITALVGITRDGTLTSPFIYRKGEFEELSVIENEMGITKYIRAKKPFYSMLSDGLVVVLKASVDYMTKEYLEEESSYELYVLNGDLPRVPSKGVLFKKVSKVPKELDTAIKEPLRILGESFGDREEFLRRRI